MWLAIGGVIIRTSPASSRMPTTSGSRGFATEKDLGIVLVDHKLDELSRVATRIVALVDGRVRIDAPLASLDRAQIVEAIAGEEGVGLMHAAADVTDAVEEAAQHAAPAPSLRARSTSPPYTTWPDGAGWGQVLGSGVRGRRDPSSGVRLTGR